MVILLVAAALAAASPNVPAFADRTPADAYALTAASPAMFVVRDADTTIFLFGTFHALDGQSEWFDHAVRSAFDQSGELVLETRISDRLTSATASTTPSFLATSRLAISAGRARGMKVANGADMVLRRAADAAGKPVAGLETIESQLSMVMRIPGPAMPRAGAPIVAPATMDDLSAAMAEMQAAWKRGDQAVFVRMLGELRQSAPGTYRTLFAARNARWADWVAARMDSPGTVFVAVGAGHLAGSDSLLVRLAQMGIESARMQ